MIDLIHISNNYVSSRVHQRLAVSIADHFGVKQHVHIPIRQSVDSGINEVDHGLLTYAFSIYPGRWLKYFPLLKILFNFLAFRFSLRKRGLSKVSGAKVLAHNLWTDGGIAFFYSLFTRAPYFVVVRNADFNWFIPKLPHYRWLIRLIVARAAGVIFVSKAYEAKFIKRYPGLYRVAKKVAVIPNGVDEFWNERVFTSSAPRKRTALFVGRFDKNKNLRGFFEGVRFARSELPGLEAVLVGGDREGFLKLLGLSTVPDWISFKGHVTNQEELCALYRSAGVLVVPSFHETFGLVYVEALSQGCPVIYTKDEGVDGFFDGLEFCRAVDPRDWEGMGVCIAETLRLFPSGVHSDFGFLRQFRWKSVAKEYLMFMGFPM